MKPQALDHGLLVFLLGLVVASVSAQPALARPKIPVLQQPAVLEIEEIEEEPAKQEKEPEGKTEARPVRQAAPREPAEELLEPFLEEGLLGRLHVAPAILALPEETLATRYLPLLTGDRKRLILKVKNLVAGLADVRYVERERSERTLVNMGPSIAPILDSLRKSIEDTEAKIRVTRVLKKLAAMGDEDVQRKALYARGLAEALEYRPGEAMTRALLSSLDHLDGRVRLAAIRSLGTQLEDPALASRLGELALPRLSTSLDSMDLALRNAVTVAIGAMPLAAGRAEMERIALDRSAATSHRLLALRLLAERMGPEAYAELAKGLQAAETGTAEEKQVAERLLKESHAELLARAGGNGKKSGNGAQEAKEAAPPAEQAAPPAEQEKTAESEKQGGREPGQAAQSAEAGPSSAPQSETAPPPAKDTRVQVALLDGGVFESSLLGLLHDRILVSPSVELAELGDLRLPRAAIDRVRYVGHEPAEPQVDAQARPTLIFRSGTRVAVEQLKVEGDRIRGRALGREIDAPLSLLTRLMPSPTADRAPGGSRKHDQLRVGGEKSPIDGTLAGFSSEGLRFAPEQGEERELAWKQLHSVVLRLRPEDNAQQLGDLGQYVQADLVDGQIVVGFLLDLEPQELVLASPALGVVRLPSERLLRLQLANSGRAQAGFTLICNFDTSEAFEIDGENRRVWTLGGLFSPVAAKPTPSGNVLVVEQEDHTVREYDREGNEVWSYPLRTGRLAEGADLSQPRSASRLASGNTLICDTENHRVIEVTPEHEIVWQFTAKQAKSTSFKPFNADRLPNGNTLITDQPGSRVLEVDPQGKVVWERKSLPWPWDADRLPNGNTLVVCSEPGQVVEIDPSGQIIWKIDGENGLFTPIHVERLPDGTTMVCDIDGNGEDEKGGQVRFFDRTGRQVQKIPVDYPVCAKRY